MKKYINWKQLLIFSLICMTIANFVPLQTKAESKTKSEYFNVNAYMENPVQVKLGWQKKDVTKYVIYRANAKKDGTVGTYKRIADLSGKKVAYFDTISDMDLEEIWRNDIQLKGKYYSYQVYGYKKINGKFKEVYHGSRLVYTGAWNTIWDEYQHCDAKVTPTSIPLSVWSGREFKPDYYRIYRSNDGKKFKLLTEIKSSDYGINYVDTNVKKGKSYYYKARTYRIVGGEKIFSNYTNTLMFSAVNREGTYQYKLLTPSNELTSELVMKISSDKNNGDVTFFTNTKHGWNALVYYSNYEYKDEFIDIELKLASYSYDNKKWTDFTEKEQTLTIKPGKTIYLRFKTKNGKEFYYLGANDSMTTLIYEEVEYNNLTSSMNFNQDTGTITARIIGEYYH